MVFTCARIFGSFTIQSIVKEEIYGGSLAGECKGSRVGYVPATKQVSGGAHKDRKSKKEQDFPFKGNKTIVWYD